MSAEITITVPGAEIATVVPGAEITALSPAAMITAVVVDEGTSPIVVVYDDDDYAAGYMAGLYW